jgi:uncharacterized protein
MRPSEREAEYFARMEFVDKKKIEEEKHKKLAQELIEIDYREIKIDKCSECDGVWLDAGELEQVAKMDKIGLDKLFSVFRK